MDKRKMHWEDHQADKRGVSGHSHKIIEPVLDAVADHRNKNQRNCRGYGIRIHQHRKPGSKDINPVGQTDCVMGDSFGLKMQPPDDMKQGIRANGHSDDDFSMEHRKRNGRKIEIDAGQTAEQQPNNKLIPGIIKNRFPCR